MSTELKVGDRVEVERKRKKDAIPEKATGTIHRISHTITIGGEPTAYIDYDDGVDSYWCPLSKIKKLS